MSLCNTASIYPHVVVSIPFLLLGFPALWTPLPVCLFCSDVTLLLSLFPLCSVLSIISCHCHLLLYPPHSILFHSYLCVCSLIYRIYDPRAARPMIYLHHTNVLKPTYINTLTYSSCHDPYSIYVYTFTRRPRLISSHPISLILLISFSFSYYLGP